MPQKTEFKYWGFGLKIKSEIEFPELLPYSFESPDVVISLGRIPVPPNKEIKKNKVFKYILSDSDMHFWTEGIADYAVQNGTTIIIEPLAPLTDPRNIRLFVLSFPIAAILWQRHLLPLHSSAILHKNELVCITGHSRAGKSSSVAGLSSRGYQVFSDDVVVINSSMMASASYPIVKLWEDAQQKLNNDYFSNQSFAIKQGLNKFGIFFHESFNTDVHRIKKIFILKNGDVTRIITKKLNNAEAFLNLRKNVYRNLFATTNELKTLAFHTVSALVNSCSVYELTRPNVCDINMLVDEMEDLIRLTDE